MQVIGHIYDDTASVPIRTVLDDGTENGLIVDGYYADSTDVTPGTTPVDGHPAP